MVAGGMHGCRGTCMVVRGGVVTGGMCGSRGGVRGCMGACVVARGHGI